MTLVQAWMDSLTLFKPKNFQLFVVAMLASLQDTYKLMFKYFWWLMLLIEVCYIPALLSVRSATISLWLFQLLLFAVCAIARSSVVKKDCAYLRSQLYSFIYFAIFLLILPKEWWLTAFSAFAVFSILFLLDSEKGPKNFFLSLWYALKMILFNFPIIVCLYGIMWCLNAAIFGGVDILILIIVKQWPMTPFTMELAYCIGLIHSIFAILLMPIGVCTYANIYIKKLYDQSDLYPNPVQQ